MRNLVRRVSSRWVHQGNLVKLRIDEVILPRGSNATYEYVEIKPGSSVLAIEDNDDVWLVREWKYALDKATLEVVSGGIEPEESPENAAHRELREELGLTASELTPLGYVDPFTTMLKCPNYLFVARGLSRVEREPDEAEVAMETVRVPFERALQHVMDGDITHATSCALILKVAAKRATR